MLLLVVRVSKEPCGEVFALYVASTTTIEEWPNQQPEAEGYHKIDIGTHVHLPVSGMVRRSNVGFEAQVLLNAMKRCDVLLDQRSPTSRLRRSCGSVFLLAFKARLIPM